MVTSNCNIGHHCVWVNYTGIKLHFIIEFIIHS